MKRWPKPKAKLSTLKTHVGELLYCKRRNGPCDWDGSSKRGWAHRLLVSARGRKNITFNNILVNMLVWASSYWEVIIITHSHVVVACHRAVAMVDNTKLVCRPQFNNRRSLQTVSKHVSLKPAFSSNAIRWLQKDFRSHQILREITFWLFLCKHCSVRGLSHRFWVILNKRLFQNTVFTETKSKS